MKISAFLEKYELSGAELAKQLGYTGAESVNSRRRRDEDIPEAWLPRLAEVGYDVTEIGVPSSGNSASFRDHDMAPGAPPGAPQAPTLPRIDYASVAGHIEGVYKLTAQMAIRPSDPLLADVVESHAQQAAIAWARWIESEPKVAAMLQRLMIGTPLGEVIGVHIAIVFTYTVARSAARSAIDDAAQRRDGDGDEAATEHGPTEVTPEDFVGRAWG